MDICQPLPGWWERKGDRSIRQEGPAPRPWPRGRDPRALLTRLRRARLTGMSYGRCLRPGGGCAPPRTPGTERLRTCLEPLAREGPDTGVTPSGARTSPPAVGAPGRASGEDVETVAKREGHQGSEQSRAVGLFTGSSRRTGRGVTVPLS